MAALLFKWLLISGTFFVSGILPKVDNATDSQTKTAASHPDYHPFYISVTEIEQNPKEKILEVSCKLFAEDLEQILEKNYKTTLDISLDKDKSRFDQLIPDYIAKHLGIVVDGRVAHLTYIGFEKEKESVYCYLQVDQVAAVKNIAIHNSLLHDFIEEQINIMHVTVNGKRQSTKLNYPDKEASFSF